MLFVQEPGKECDASLSTLCGGSRMVVFGSLFGVSWAMPHSVLESYRVRRDILEREVMERYEKWFLCA